MHLDPGHGDERGRGSSPARGHGKVTPDCRRTARRWVSHTGQREPLKAAEAKTLIDRLRRTQRTFAFVRRIAPQRQGAGKLSVALQAASVTGNFPPFPLTLSLWRHAAALSAVAGRPATRLAANAPKAGLSPVPTQRRRSP